MLEFHLFLHCMPVGFRTTSSYQLLQTYLQGEVDCVSMYIREAGTSMLTLAIREDHFTDIGLSSHFKSPTTYCILSKKNCSNSGLFKLCALCEGEL